MHCILANDVRYVFSSHTGLMDTLRDCLEELNLTQFRSQVEATSLNETLASADSMLTVFAPNDEAFDGIGGLPFGDLAGHVAEGIKPSSKLFHDAIIRPLAEGRLLHVTDVVSYKGWGHRRMKVSIAV